MSNEIMVPAIGEENGHTHGRMSDMRDFAMTMNVRSARFRVRSVQDHKGILSVLYAADTPLAAMDFMANRWEDHIEYVSYHAFEGKAGTWIVYYVDGSPGNGIFDRNNKSIVYPSQVSIVGSEIGLAGNWFHIGPDSSGVGFSEIVKAFRKVNGWRGHEAKFVPGNDPFEADNPFDI